MIERLCSRFSLTNPQLVDAARFAYERIRDVRYDAQLDVKANVMAAFLDVGVMESDFAGSTGYGYDDAAREAYERLIAHVFGAQAASRACRSPAARTRSSRRSPRAPRRERRCSASPADRTTRCATRLRRRADRSSNRASRMTKSR